MLITYNFLNQLFENSFAIKTSVNIILRREDLMLLIRINLNFNLKKHKPSQIEKINDAENFKIPTLEKEK